MMRIIQLGFVGLSLLVTCKSFAQNLLAERVWKLPDHKTSLFLEKGIFFTAPTTQGIPAIQAIRYGGQQQPNQERVVIDFDGATPPRIYGQVSSSERKIFIDLIDARLKDDLKFLGKGKMVENVDIYPLDPDRITLEFTLKDKYSFDVFYLGSPGRLVIDLKK